ncbi:hypothetical protein [Nonomuraea rubra]
MVVVNLGRDEPVTPPLTTVRGVIGSEPKAFFEDPQGCGPWRAWA